MLSEAKHHRIRFDASGNQSKLPSISSLRAAQNDTGVRSDHAELHSAGFADHVLVPRRIPDELHVGFIDAVYAQNFALRIVRDCRSHSATGRGQSHFYFDARSAIFFFAQATIVDQTEINNVNGDLGIVTLPELVPDVFL